jgi:GNAT superfamily N-acetyltransferase
LDAIVRIYEASIPASERKPASAIREMARRPEYLLIAATDNDQVLGFAALFAPPDEPFALLEYLAVDESSRGQGVGAGLFTATLQAAAPHALLLELEAAIGHDDTERELRRRRQAFYRRLGCQRIIDLHYQLPLRTAGVPPAMHLFVHRGAITTPMTRADLGRALRRIYSDVYAKSPDDPRIAEMLAPLPDPLSLA